MKLYQADIIKKIFIFIVALFLLSYNLSDRYLWYDEACSALTAKNILKYGYPRAYDGRNFSVACRDGTVIYKGKDLYIYSQTTPIHYYLTAASFKLFGINTQTARLPFIIIGIISIFLFGRLARKFGISANIASLYLVLNICFLLYCKNARYYALVFLFSILLTDFYLQFLRNTSKWALLKFTITSILFVYTHQLAFFASHLGFFIFSILFLKKKQKLYFILAWFLPVLSYLPWHYFFFPYAHQLPLVWWSSPAIVVESVWSNLWNINNYIFPFVFWGILPFILLKNFDKGYLGKETILLCILAGCIIGGIIIYNPSLHLTRYILGSLPLLFLLILLILEHIKHRKLLYYAILATLIGTNFFHTLPTFLLFKVGKLDLTNFAEFTPVFSGHEVTNETYNRLRHHTEFLYDRAKFDSYLCLYIFCELFSKYESREEVIVEYLRKYVKEDDTFMVCEGDASVLIFYLDKIRVVNRFSKKSPIKPDPTACPIDKVKWIIPHKRNPRLITLAKSNNYYKIMLNYPDIPPGKVSQNVPNPELIEDRYEINKINYSQPNIVIYRKRE